jgi:predicted amidohydrolase
MNVYCVQFDSQWNEKEENFKLVSTLLNEYSIHENSLIILPEMFATGFHLNPKLTTENEPQKTENFLSELAKQKKSWIIGGMCQPSENEDMAYNTAVTFNPNGERISLYKKIHPIPALREDRFHLAGNSVECMEINSFKTTPAICYDLRFPELFRKGLSMGANLFVVLGCWPKSRIQHWVTLLKARAIENQAYMIGVNRVGNDQELEYGGRSMIISPTGEILADASDETVVMHSMIQEIKVREWRNSFPAVQEFLDEKKLK